MANTFMLYANAVTWAAGKNMLAINNHTGSGQVVRIYRIWMNNISASTVTGGTCLTQMFRYTSVASFTAGTSIAFNKMDSTAAAPNANIFANAGTTTSLTKDAVPFRQILRSNDELALSTGHLEDLESILPLSLIWESGYGFSTVEPITLRAGEGLVLFTPSSGGGTYAGQTEINVELTVT
jgi:hypothetical protein